MNLKALEGFMAMAKAGSLSRAARQMNVAQPALSRVLATLESELGQTLFLRHARGVTLTDAGALLRERAETILADVSRLSGDLRARVAEPQGRLAVGLPPSFASAFAVGATAHFMARAPRAHLTLREGPTQDLLAALSNSELDAAVATLGTHSRRFDVTVLGRDHMGIFCPRGTKLDPAGVSIRALAGRPIVLMSNTRFMMERIEKAAADAGVTLTFGMETNSLLAVRLVAAGLSHTIMPMCVMRSDEFRDTLVAAPILELPIEWGLCTARAKPASAALGVFRDALLQGYASAPVT